LPKDKCSIKFAQNCWCFNLYVLSPKFENQSGVPPNYTMKYQFFKYLLFLLIFSVSVSLITSCGSSKNQAQASEDGGKKKKKKKAPRCKMPSCHVRMMHLHDDAEFRGKGTWFLKRWLYFGKDPKIGEGLKKTKRDPHQWKTRSKQ